MPNSSNTPFTDSQITTFFPTDTTADTRATILKVEQLVLDGFVDDAQFAQIASAVGTYIDTIAEAYPLTSAVYTGTAGSTSRKYRAVPTYPLPAQINDALPFPPFGFFPNPPPQGFPLPNSNPLLANTAQPGNTYGGRIRFYGKMSATTTVASTAATLDSAHYVTVTLPAASAHAPNVLFDVLVQDAGTGDYNMIATGVAPAGVVVDTGLTRQAYAMSPNTTLTSRYAHAEVGIDTNADVGDGWNQGITVYGMNTMVNPGFVT